MTWFDVTCKLVSGGRRRMNVPQCDGACPTAIRCSLSDIGSARMERALRDGADVLEAADRLKNMFRPTYPMRSAHFTSVLFASVCTGMAAGCSPSRRNMYRRS
jgi:hypothetical protein